VRSAHNIFTDSSLYTAPVINHCSEMNGLRKRLIGRLIVFTKFMDCNGDHNIRSKSLKLLNATNHWVGEHDCAPLMITKKIDNFHEIHGLKWRLRYSIEIIEFVECNVTNDGAQSCAPSLGLEKILNLTIQWLGCVLISALGVYWSMN
jgi:hypothetical protein